MMNKKNFFRSLSIILTLALAISLGTSLLQQDSTAGAESVTLSQNATVVTSPFTEAVKKVHGSVVGVNNYAMSYGYNSFGDFGFPFGFGFGYGYGNGNQQSEPEEVLAGSGSGGMGSGHGNTQQRIGAQAALVLGAIQRDQPGIQTGLSHP